VSCPVVHGASILPSARSRPDTGVQDSLAFDP
jgi:hypothetical protein